MFFLSQAVLTKGYPISCRPKCMIYIPNGLQIRDSRRKIRPPCGQNLSRFKMPAKDRLLLSDLFKRSSTVKTTVTNDLTQA